jgi:hypothetical protein
VIKKDKDTNVSKKESKAKKKKDKELDAGSIDIKPNIENIKESNPKKRSAQKEIE